MRRPREQDTVNAILTFLQAHRIPAWRMNSGAFRAEYKGKARFHRFGVTGMSDIIGVIPCQACKNLAPADRCHLRGQFLAVEVKTATGRLTEPQLRLLQTVKDAGGIALVARSVEDVKQGLGL
jgi:hypothetical protein